MFSNSGGNYNSAAEIVLSALKYGAPNIAVGAMVLKFYTDCNLFCLGQHVQYSRGFVRQFHWRRIICVYSCIFFHVVSATTFK